MIIARIWDELCRRGIRTKKVTEDSEVVRFPCPFVERPGKHGHGRAIYDAKSRPEFIAVVLLKLQMEGVLPYFHIVAPSGAKAGPDAANHPDTLFAPGIVIANKREFLEGFCPREQEVLGDLEQAIRKLGPSEIRAVGTHCGRDQTIQAIIWEFEAIQEHFLWTKLIDAIGADAPFGEYAQEVLEYMDEACRKSLGNRAAYSQGRNIFLTELQDPELREVFAQLHSDPSDIWEFDQVQVLAARASKARALSQLLVQVSNAQDVIAAGGTISEKQVRFLSKAVEQCDGAGITDLPGTVDQVFSGQKLSSEFKKRLVAEIMAVGNIRQMNLNA